MKKALAILATILLFSFTTLAQSSVSANTTVTASVVKGLTITPNTGSLDFGLIGIDAINSQSPSIDPGSGVSFLVNGQAGKDVNITYTNISLSGPGTSIAFNPNLDQTGPSNIYSGATDLPSGDAASLGATDGNLYLWLGGSLSVAAGQAQGDYSGTFTITVAY